MFMCALFCITIALINLFDLNGKTFSTVTSIFCDCEVFLQSGRAGHEFKRSELARRTQRKCGIR